MADVGKRDIRYSEFFSIWKLIAFQNEKGNINKQIHLKLIFWHTFPGFEFH